MSNKIKVALADDHHLFRKGVEELIEDFDNIEVLISVGNGKDLLEKMSVSSLLPDVCLQDNKNPDIK